MLAITVTGYGLMGLLVIVLFIVRIIHFVRRA